MIVKHLGFHQNVFYQLDRLPELKGNSIFLKLEGFNLSGSIKLKPAVYMIEQMEAKGIIEKGRNSIIESSSGNLAMALAQVCHAKGYKFTAVVDVNTTKEALAWLALFNAQIIVIDVPDSTGGFLESRIARIKEIIGNNPSCIWVNQYANPDNVDSHYHFTAPEILADFPKPDYIFVGAGTTGTLGGIIKYFSIHSPRTKIIGVDSEGSVTFDKAPAHRYIPGIGTSRKPEISIGIEQLAHDIIWINELDGINMCKRLLSDYSILLGGSTGSIVAGALTYADKFLKDDVIICLSPDFGHKYIDTVYNADWVKNKFTHK